MKRLCSFAQKGPVSSSTPDFLSVNTFCTGYFHKATRYRRWSVDDSKLFAWSEQNSTDSCFCLCEPVVACEYLSVPGAPRGVFMNATSKCAHPACSCERADGKKYCSQTCADAKGLLELTCQCRHTACLGAQLKT